MARSLARCRINARTPISVEREFSLYNQDARPISRQKTNRFMESLRSSLAGRNYEVVEEVAGNSFELKVCFSSPGQIREELRFAYKEILRQAQDQGLLVSGISSPFHAEDFNSFFTTLAFPNGKRFIGRTNSIHIHFSGESEGELVDRYNVGNIIAPLLLDISQSSVIDGEGRGRACQIWSFLCSVPDELARPVQLDGFSSFHSHLERARAAAEKEIRRTINGASQTLCSLYPDFARMNGHGIELLQLTPDKLFSLARLRPDKRSDRRGLAGSVEIRSLDGQATLERDLAMIELTIGLLAYCERSVSVLGEREIEGISRAIGRVAKIPINSDVKRFSLALAAIENARSGLEQMDLSGEHLGCAEELVHRPGYTEYKGMDETQIIRESAEQFTSGVS